MNDTILDRLFSGDLDKSVQLPKRVVRLFISSTFTDMTLERNSLMERVYPRLKKYCRERYGLDFQVVDMRWGVRDEATDDHQTVNLCSREIQNCQRISLGPNFVALLGDKYGFRPLCNRIKSSEYRALRRCLIELDINTDFLDTWYKEDLNAVPAEYLLQPISSILKNFTNKSEPELQSLDQKIWLAIQDRLHELLMIGSARLVKQGRMSEQEQLMKYSISVTEREVIEGCLDLKEARSHCLVYVRSIKDLPDHLSRCLDDYSQITSGSDSSTPTSFSPTAQLDKGNKQRSNQPNSLSPNLHEQQQHPKPKQVKKKRDSRKASLKIGNDTINLTTSVPQSAAERRLEKTRKLIARYIDLSSTKSNSLWKLDDEAQKALAHLKEVKLEEKLRNCQRNFTKYEIGWHEQEGVSLKSEEHKHYIDELTEHFYANMTRMIRRASKSNEQMIKTGLIGEVLQHLHYAKHVSKTFHGRNKELNKIRAYFMQQHQQQHHHVILPMFIYGVGGSGKTSILARASTLARDWIMGGTMGARHVEERWDQRPCIISRFCGTTPNSSSMVGVLTSVCRQLQFHFYQYGPLNGAINQNKTFLSSINNNSNNNQSTRNQNEPANTTNAQLDYQTIPEDFVRLVFTFRKLLENCQHPFHKQRLFIIILDSVERLTSPAESSIEVKYSWLTSLVKLPINVRLVVSCSSEKTADYLPTDYQHLKRHFLKSHYNLIKPYLSAFDVGISNEESSNNVRCELDDSIKDSNFSNKNEKVDYLSKTSYTSSSSPTGSNSLRVQDNGRMMNKELLDAQPNRYQLLKRVLVPAVRLMKQMNKTANHTKITPTVSANTNNYSHLTKLITPKNETTNSTTSLLSNRWSISGQSSSGGAKYNQQKLHLQNDQFERENNLMLADELGDVEDLGLGSSFGYDYQQQHSPTSRSSAGASISPFSGGGGGKAIRDANNESGDISPVDLVWILHVRPMGVELASNVLRRWLLDVGRNLTQQQWSIVEKSFHHCSRPIFVKLAFNEIINWKSYSMQSNTKGLTFGSSLLETERENVIKRIKKGPESSGKDDGSTVSISRIDQIIKRLLEDSGESGTNELSESDEFKWQILTMEQQWLNYLDYKQREQQKSSITLTGSSGKDEISSNQNKTERDVIIRVGTSGTGGAGGSGMGGASGIVSGSSSASLGHSSALNASICHLSYTIDNAICQLFARIELQHGFILTKHSLSYITAARNGICENELEDILSLDDVVLDDVFQYHLPPVRRIPPLLWTRIRSDLPDYLSERDADGIVINWHHGQFKQVTQKRYLTDAQQVFYIHSNMADYFLGKWADKAKPFKCTKQQIQMAAEQLESAVQQSLRESQTLGGSARSGQQQRNSSFYAGRPSLGSVGISRPAHGPSLSGGHYTNRLRSSQQDQRFQVLEAKANRRVPHQPLYYSSSNYNQSMDGSSSSVDGTTGVSGTSSAVGGGAAGGANTLTIGAGGQGTVSGGRFDLGVQREKRRYNIRKLTELPYHLIKSGRFQDLANNVLFNYKWLYAAIDALGLQYLLADFEEASRGLSLTLEELKQQENFNNEGQASQLKSMQSSRFGLYYGELLDYSGVSTLSELDFDTKYLKSMLNQLNVLNNTIRLSCSSIHSDTQMVASQVLGRLLPLVREAKITNQAKFNELKFLSQLLDQCDKDGCSDCALLPTDHCLQSPDGLQLSSLEGHSFAIMSMCIASDQRHLLAVSNRFIMWDITTGEVSRDIDPKIDGSIMKELKMGLNNEYAIAYTSNNVILALDILTQQVTKFCELTGTYKNKFNQTTETLQNTCFGGEEILGLNLIDKFGASRFLVWTSTKWFVMRVVNNELNRSVSMSDRITIELEYFVDMSDIENNVELILSVQMLSDRGVMENSGVAHHDDSVIGAAGHSHSNSGDSNDQDRVCSDIAFAIITRKKPNLIESDKTEIHNQRENSSPLLPVVELITMESSRTFNLQSVFQVWNQKLEAQTICLDENLRQVVYSDFKGDIYLSRRRHCSWSRGKLIFRAKMQCFQSDVDEDARANLSSSILSRFNTSVTSSIPLEIELDNKNYLQHINQLDPLYSETSAKKRFYLAKLERQLDSLLAKDHDEVTDDNCVFQLEENTKQDSDNSVKKKNVTSSGRLLPKKRAHNQLPIKIVKLYLNNKIIVILLDSSSRTLKERIRDNNQSYDIKCLRFPENIRNISLKPNQCQVKSIIIRDNDKELSNYLVAAVGKRLLLYSLDTEQFLKLVDAHGARIVELIPILSGRSSMNLSGQSSKETQSKRLESSNKQLTIASASMDKTVKIWNLLNVNKDIHKLENLEGSIESMSVSLQRPFVACLSRGQVGVWDWQTLKLIIIINHSDLMSLTKTTPKTVSSNADIDQNENDIMKDRAEKSENFQRDGKFVACKFSFNGRYLCLSTLDFIYLLSIDSLSGVNSTAAAGSITSNTSPVSSPREQKQHFSTSSTSSSIFGHAPALEHLSQSTNKQSNTSKLNFKLSFKRNLPDGTLVRKLKFFQQDSRILTVLQCKSTVTEHQQQHYEEQQSGNVRSKLRYTRPQSSSLGGEVDGASNSSTSEQTDSLRWRFTWRLLIYCYSIPDGRLLFSIEYFTPSMQPTQDSHYLTSQQPLESDNLYSSEQSSEKRDSLGELSNANQLQQNRHDKASKLIASNQIRLPVLTMDHSSIVTVENTMASLVDLQSVNDRANSRSSTLIDGRRRSSAIMRIPLLLNVYSTRDGLLLHSINLSNIEMFNPQQQQQQQSLYNSNSFANRKRSLPQVTQENVIRVNETTSEATTNTLSAGTRKGSQDLIYNQNLLKMGQVKQAQTLSQQQQQQQQQFAITGDQFSRLKPVKSFQNERQSIVALIDDEKGSSFLIDVQAKQLLTCSNLWNGKVSADGRFGLSRMFKSAALRGAVTAAAGSSRQQLYGGENLTSSGTDQLASAAGSGSLAGLPTEPSSSSLTTGLRLLEMRRCTVVRSLLSNQMLSKLATTDIQTTGSDTDITCGFTRPNDAYVYFYSSRLKRLLLVRLCDSELIANYKLSSAKITKIKCSPDGYALILAFSDGSLTSLAIVDPMKSETLVRLTQYPSRAS